MNIIFAEDEKSFKLIDLGACADLRSGTNYIPDESILDPTYCPPEQVVPENTCIHASAACSSHVRCIQPLPAMHEHALSMCPMRSCMTM